MDSPGRRNTSSAPVPVPVPVSASALRHEYHEAGLQSKGVIGSFRARLRNGLNRVSGRLVERRGDNGGVFGGALGRRQEVEVAFSGEPIDDEMALRWAALDKLPTYDRLRTAILRRVAEDGNILAEEVDITRLSCHERQLLMDKFLLLAADDNERLLRKLRERIDRVGIELPKIEVRFEHLSVHADVYVGSRSLPTLFNFTLNALQDILAWVHLVPSKKHNLAILHDVSGIVRPSRITLLLGPPASGRTTLLLALAGKLDPALKVSGCVTYNGHELTEFVPQRTSAYISQHDLQIGMMTVRETLDFSGRCQGVGTRYDMLMELSRREKMAGIEPDPDIDAFMKACSVEGAEASLVTDYILKILGLDVCADTIVGDEMRRGISGGQRKRVTTGEMLVGPCLALFMDEISTGLDSSTTFQIVEYLKQSVQVMDGTMVAALLQPAPETFELFDDLILLSEGQIVYQGPRDFVMDFFEHMGFKCPERKNVADFLQEVTSKKDQEQYWAVRSQPYHYIPVKEFVESFKSFHVGQRLAQDLAAPYDKSKSHPAALATQKYGLPQWELLKACFAREWLLMKRNAFVYIFCVVQISMLAIITMTLFFRTKLHQRNESDGNTYLGALFFGLTTCMFNGFPESNLIISRLPVFYKHRDMFLYPAWVFGLPTWLMSIPTTILQTCIWTVLTYYVIGYSPEAERFFKHFLLLFLMSQMAMGLFRFIAAVGRSMEVVNTIGTFALVMIFVLGGFILSRYDKPSWWIWGFWTSPLMYGQMAIAVNEFLADRWNKPSNDTSANANTLGKAILVSRGLFDTSNWYWIGVGALCGYIILFNILYILALTYLNPLGKPQANISQESLEEKHANQTGDSKRLSYVTVSNGSRKMSNTEGMDLQVKCSRRSGMSLNRSSSQFDGSNGAALKKGMILPFQPLALAFDTINYYVDMPAEMKQHGMVEDRLRLLQDVSGAFKPGVLTALVGVSGAGKTTLMDVLAGRKTGGYIEGHISVSGYPKKQDTFTQISGYCEQNDIHSPNITVHESLIYSAWLRLPKEVDAQTRMQFVDEVMELVELWSIKGALVGLPGVSGLSTEQRKRLTIAVELVSNPSIIFMDEPTSGLDARAAAIVMRTVRNTVDTGRTVVCTIHQPSIDIFEAFDELLLMKTGGQVIYCGPLGRESCRLVEYFESIPGVPKIKEGYNPATWMLEVTSQSVETHLGVDFADIFRNSALYERNQSLVKELSTPAPGSKELHFETQYCQTSVVQFLACLWKQHKSYWRNPLYNVVRFFFTGVMAFIFGTIYWKLGQKRGTSEDLLNIMGGMFAATLFLGVSNGSSVQPVVGIERTVFYREKAAGMYSPLPYALAQAAIEIPYTMTQTIMYAVVVYSMMDFTWTAAKFLWFMYFMFCLFLYCTYYGMMCVSVSPSYHVAAIISSFFYAMWNLFSGFLITYPAMPVWWQWYYWATPVAWTLYGLITSQMGDDSTDISVPGGHPQTVSFYLRHHFGFHHSFLGVVAGMNIMFVILFAFVFAFCIKYLNFQRR
eukprot:c25359_g2_i2 orf=102-4673(+)